MQTVREHADPAEKAELVKYVQFSAILPAPQDFSKTQQTPNPDAQVPLELPLRSKEYLIYVVCIMYYTTKKLSNEVHQGPPSTVLHPAQEIFKII